jgi:hypothetical protein
VIIGDGVMSHDWIDGRRQVSIAKKSTTRDLCGAVPTNNSINSIGIVKTTCDPVGDASSITHSRLNREAALTVTRRSENGRMCAPQVMRSVAGEWRDYAARRS